MAGFFARLFKPERLKYFLAVDLGSHSAIRAILFETSGGNRDPRIMAKRSFNIPHSRQDQKRIPYIETELRKLIFQTVRVLHRPPDEVLVGIDSQFAFNRKEVVRFERKDPSKAINPQELKQVIAKQLTETHQQIIAGQSYHLAVTMPFLVEVDGYPIEHFYPRLHGKTISITLFNTYVMDQYWQDLNRLRQMFGGVPMNFVSNQAAVAGMIISKLNMTESLIVKIGAKMTEVSLLKQGVIRATGQFRSGGDDATAAIQQALGLDFFEAERLKLEMEHAPTATAAVTKAKAAVKLAAKKWLDDFTVFLKSKDEITVPETLFLFGGGARLNEIVEALRNEPWFRNFTFRPRVNVVRLDARDLNRFVFNHAVTLPLSGPEEVPLTSLVIRLVAEPEAGLLSFHHD